MSSTSDSTKAVKQPQQIENIAPLAVGGKLKYFQKLLLILLLIDIDRSKAYSPSWLLQRNHDEQ